MTSNTPDPQLDEYLNGIRQKFNRLHETKRDVAKQRDGGAEALSLRNSRIHSSVVLHLEVVSGRCGIEKVEFRVVRVSDHI